MPETEQKKKSRGDWFGRWAQMTSRLAGHPVAFLFAASSLVIWGVMGPLYGYSDTWQLVANTATSLITFLMVFIIQNSQNRDTQAIHLKLDELIRALKLAHNEMIDIEKLSDAELQQLAKRYKKIREEWDDRQAEGATQEPAA